MDSKYFLRQHKDISLLVGEIESLLPQSEYIVKNAADISYKIGALSGKLSLHLKAEDNYLYPKIQQKNKKIAQKFIDELSPITQTFSYYKKKYMIATNIKSNPAKFIEDTRQIIEALRRRIEVEEKELYPVLYEKF